MEMVKNAVSWIEIPVSDFNRAKKFYSAIYDYEMPEAQMGPNRMGFLLYDQPGGGIGGAIVQGNGYTPSSTGAKIYLNAGSDLNLILNRVEKAGGKVVMAKTQISLELGYFGIFMETEGNQVSLHSMT